MPVEHWHVFDFDVQKNHIMKTLKTLTNTGILPLILFLACFALASCSSKPKDDKEVAEDQNEKKLDSTKIEDDTEFAVEAADGGMLEVELGKLAQANGSSEKVKMFGEMMVTDHSKANDELKALAAQKNISLPGALSDKSRKSYEDIAAKKGKDFDDDYTDLMVKDHKKDIDEFKKEAEKGKDPDLKSWAAGKISVLEHHLEMAKKAQNAADSLKHH
jgi:putative membrane protein